MHTPPPSVPPLLPALFLPSLPVGTINWTDAASNIFPSGLRYMYDQTGWPVVGHARAWSTKNVYATQNGGAYNFSFDEDDAGQKLALPTSHKFWDYMLRHNKCVS